jgi:hypothetical protein
MPAAPGGRHFGIELDIDADALGQLALMRVDPDLRVEQQIADERAYQAGTTRRVL